MNNETTRRGFLSIADYQSYLEGDTKELLNDERLHRQMSDDEGIEHFYLWSITMKHADEAGLLDCFSNAHRELYKEQLDDDTMLCVSIPLGRYKAPKFKFDEFGELTDAPENSYQRWRNGIRVQIAVIKDALRSTERFKGVNSYPDGGPLADAYFASWLSENNWIEHIELDYPNKGDETFYGLTDPYQIKVCPLSDPEMVRSDLGLPLSAPSFSADRFIRLVENISEWRPEGLRHRFPARELMKKQKSEHLARTDNRQGVR